ncbi:MAG TPA: (d)CMP kinase [Clostridia bacterium]|nr:(d)CMP kinase [Clostridia bacterium]
MLGNIRLAIDGPAGAGKSTIARLVAKELGFTYIDTGAMYRALTLDALDSNISMADEGSLTALASGFDINFTPTGEGTRVISGNRDVTEEIRAPVVSRNVSFVAKVPGVRRHLTELQRKLAAPGGVVMEGRDIGTEVLPDAEIKIFLTASIEERARRRYLEMTERGYEVNPGVLHKEIEERDSIDSSRSVAPLRIAEDALIIDCSDMAIDDVVNTVMEIVSGG